MTDIVLAIEAYLARRLETDLLEMARRYFAARRWPCELVADGRALEVAQDWSGMPFKSRAHVKGGGPTFIYDSCCPEVAPADRRDAVARYLTRVNAGMLVGAFEMDWDTGAIRCRTAIDLHGGTLTEELLGGVVYPHHQAMIDYLSNLVAVLRGEQDPDDAYRETQESIG